MPIRSLLLSVVILSASGLAAAQTSLSTAESSAPKPHPAVLSPRYVGPMGTNPTPSAFATLQANQNLFPAPTQTTKLILPRSHKSTCYAIHSYTIKPESDTIGITHPTSESTCVAANSSSMKQATQPSSGPAFR